MEILSKVKCFGGEQIVCRAPSASTRTDMTFGLFLPPKARTARTPVLLYLSGLTCTHENVLTKAGAQRACAEHGVALLAPDTSPRGLDLPGERDSYDFGAGAGFYLDATREPWAGHYNMYSYVTQDLFAAVAEAAPTLDLDRVSITGHSMGGHGALTIALKNPGRFRSVSAFAPISSPMRCPWGEKALLGYLGEDRAAWRAYDATALIEDGARTGPILVDQGTQDTFLERELRPDLLEDACARARIGLTLRRQGGYDHSYYFIATFIDDHISFAAEALAAPVRGV